MDAFSNALSLMMPRTYGAGAFDLGGDWSIDFPQHEGIKCYAIVSGQCWLAVEGVPEALLLKAGECFLLPLGRPFRLASDLAVTSVPYTSLPRSGGIASGNGGGDCFIVGGHFALDGVHADLVLGGLAPIVHLRNPSDKAALRWSLDRMRHELVEQQPGASLIAQHFAQMILILALRLHVADEKRGGRGLLFAMADKNVGSALNAVHYAPAHRWTLRAMAQQAGMSRSGFALRFKELLGEAPIEHVTRWRMLLARERLANSTDSISVIALSLGYESDSAFSTAFKRIMGCSPRQYSIQQRSQGARGNRVHERENAPIRTPVYHRKSTALEFADQQPPLSVTAQKTKESSATRASLATAPT